MGNIGLEPEITREYLADEYRKACATINELRARAEKAEAKVERLREFAEFAATVRRASAWDDPILREINERARTALAEKE